MPRHQRLDLADVAQHVIQRGNNRQPCFFREIDYVRYQQDLREAAVDAGVDIHAYVLMTNHVHLLVTGTKMGAVARMMQSLGRRYVRYVNDALGRTGTLWEGRFKSSLVDSERYLLACYRYIELNPVRAGMVADASSYQWSSLGSNGFGRADGVITPHPAYLQLHPQQDERQARYRAFLMEGSAMTNWQQFEPTRSDSARWEPTSFEKPSSSNSDARLVSVSPAGQGRGRSNPALRKAGSDPRFPCFRQGPKSYRMVHMLGEPGF
jgi:putative transposase